jgi:hypothetical protein
MPRLAPVIRTDLSAMFMAVLHLDGLAGQLPASSVEQAGGGGLIGATAVFSKLEERAFGRSGARRPASRHAGQQAD